MVKENMNGISTPVKIVIVLLWHMTSLSQDGSTNLTSDTASHARRKQSLDTKYLLFLRLTDLRQAFLLLENLEMVAR